MQNSLEVKNLIIQNLFEKLEKELKKKVTTLQDSVYNLKNTYSLVSETQEILKHGEDIYNGNTSLVENLVQYTNSKIVENKTEYDKKRAQLEVALNEIKNN
ncbi:reticulocyte binding protein 2b (PcyRBP2b) putative [Plasmodium ovale curtisi]|nr:reticulocyte binding protein 2b (PcyRBP2b) putative [Plasmodium ovale curtisi]